MTKKIAKQSLKIKQDLFEPQTLSSDDLKAFATKKVRQLQMAKIKCTKISKVGREKTSSPKRSFQVQKVLFQEIIDQSTFQCPICLELMIEPTLLQCGHAYCFKCIEELMIYKSNCGVCRNAQKDAEFQRSKYLESLIEKVVLGKSVNLLEFYCRVADIQNWKRVRNVSVGELNKGSLIDFRDKELKWRKAEIVKIVFDEVRGIYQMDLKYKKEGQNIEETISSDSGRYAKFSYYTRMKYLQPRSNPQSLLSQGNQQLLIGPIPNCFEPIGEELGEFQNQNQGETFQLPLLQNAAIDELTIIPSLEQDQFLNEILAPKETVQQEFIELLV